MKGAPRASDEAIEHSREKRAREALNAPGKKAGRSKVGGVPTVGELEEQERLERCRKAGVEFCDSMVMVATGLIGPEWWYDEPKELELPNGLKQIQDERARMHQAFGETWAYHGWEKTPSGYAAIFACATYAASRMNRPETKKAVQGFKESLASWWARWRVRSAEKKRQREEARQQAKREAEARQGLPA